jgi:hypothetical protein
MPIDRSKLVDAVSEAVQDFVDNYNRANEANVSVSLEGDEAVVDGGHEHGVFTVSVLQD